MDANAGDLLEDMDYGDFNLLEEQGDFSFDGPFDGDTPDFNDSAGSFPSQPTSSLSQQQQHPLQPLQPPKQALPQPPSMFPVGHPQNSADSGNSSHNNVVPMNSSSGNFSAAAADHPMENSSAKDPPPQLQRRSSSARQPWHNDDKDRDARRHMIIEIAQLLRARKRSQPSDSWLRQLPCKARKLEERLYRSAASFEMYEDRTTLKNRLKKLARAIMQQYESSRTRSSFRSSMSSIASLNSRTSSVVSHLQQHRDSCVSQNSMDSLSTLNKQMNQKMSGLGDKERGGVSNEDFGGGNTKSSMSTSDSTVTSAAASSSSPNMQSIPEDSSKAGMGNISAKSGADKITMLEQQKQANERLQQQIMENIRKQEVLLRRLQQQQQTSPAGSGVSGSNRTTTQSGPNMMVPPQESQHLPGGRTTNSMMQPHQNNSAPNLNFSANHGMDMSNTNDSNWNTRSSNAGPATLPMGNAGRPPSQSQTGQALDIGTTTSANRNGMMAGANNNMNSVLLPGNMNAFLQMNPGVLNNPAQMQQLAQMRAAFLRATNGGMVIPPQMGAASQANGLMRSLSAGSANSNNGNNMMANFAGQSSSLPQTGPSQNQQMALSNLMGQNMMGLQAPPVLPGRALSTGQLPAFSGFNPSMPPPSQAGDGTATSGASLPQGNNAAGFNQFNWRTNNN